MKNLFFCLTTLFTIGCATQTPKTSESKPETIWVNSLKVPCTGVAPMSCFQIQKSETLSEDGWEFFYSDIKGFNFEAGYIYKLLIKIEELKRENVPADASSLKYTLVEMIEKKQDTKLRLNDIWAVQSIQGQPFKNAKAEPRSKRPLLEIHLVNMKIMGNDGCNQIMGKLEKVTDTAIEFGSIAGTKMACPDMKTPAKFKQVLGQTTSYKISNLKLYLFDENGEEVLVFQKVD